MEQTKKQQFIAQIAISQQKKEKKINRKLGSACVTVEKIFLYISEKYISLNKKLRKNTKNKNTSQEKKLPWKICEGKEFYTFERKYGNNNFGAK